MADGRRRYAKHLQQRSCPTAKRLETTEAQAWLAVGYDGLPLGSVGISILCGGLAGGWLHQWRQQLAQHPEQLVQRNVSAHRLSFTGSIEEGVDNSEVIFIAVPTPDVRSSVAVDLVNDLIREGAHVTAYDPKGNERVQELNLCPGVHLAGSALDAVRDAETLGRLANIDLGFSPKYTWRPRHNGVTQESR